MFFNGRNSRQKVVIKAGMNARFGIPIAAQTLESRTHARIPLCNVLLDFPFGRSSVNICQPVKDRRRTTKRQDNDFIIVGNVSLCIEKVTPLGHTRNVDNFIAFELHVSFQQIRQWLMGFLFGSRNHFKAFNVPRIHHTYVGQRIWLIIRDCQGGVLHALDDMRNVGNINIVIGLSFGSSFVGNPVGNFERGDSGNHGVQFCDCC
mmetsp:Transcript_14414/g.23820  ORF Transcript_14414/g.23820 Transcript_14414/m.23820 type:complete len:205 (-) Transcript_14414:62-676(-)